MRISDEQIASLKRDGFVIIENFLNPEEQRAALDGFHRWYAPSYEKFVADGRLNNATQKTLFPWDDSGLNHAITHPDLIDASERIIGTREVRLSEAHLGVKYFGEPHNTSNPGAFHIDYGNNTLGPIIEPDDFQHIFFFYCFNDVEPGMAPIQMVPNGQPDSDAAEMVVPGGSICIYTPFTRHVASEFTVPGYRAAAWVGYTRKDRPWDGARTFTYKSGASTQAMRRFIVEASPRQLELIGFPPPSDPLWTREFVQAMVQRYEGFHAEPYLQQLVQS